MDTPSNDQGPPLHEHRLDTTTTTTDTITSTTETADTFSPPSTSASGVPLPYLFVPGQPQDTIDEDEGYTDESESEVEDVFAFLPPSTADQEQLRQQQELQQQQPEPTLDDQTLKGTPGGERQPGDGQPETLEEDKTPPATTHLVSSPPPPVVDPDPFAHSPPSPSSTSTSPAPYPPPSIPPPLPIAFPSPTFSPTAALIQPSQPVPSTPLPSTISTPPYTGSDPYPSPPETTSAPAYSLYPYPPISPGSGGAGEPDVERDRSLELAPNLNTNAYRLRRVSSRTYRPPNLPADLLLPHASDSGETPVEEPSVDKDGASLAMGKLAQSVPNTSHGLSLDGFSHDEKHPEGAGESVSRETRTPSLAEEDSAGSIKMRFDLEEIDEEDSPYPEVRASVSNVDDPGMPVLTARMWVIGLFLVMIAGGLNVFFNFRQPAPVILPLVLQLVSYPIGKFFAYTLPIKTFRIPLPRPLSPLNISLNPGPWNIKEHALVYIMANVAVATPYAMDAIVVFEQFYGLKLGYWFDLNLVLATQLVGFGLAGLCRRFLVWPASMVWPRNLVACALFNTLHAEDDESQGGVSRYRYFLMVAGGAFLFWFLPGYLFQALSYFSFICWIAPNNVVINQLFGVSSGLGMSVITFDWTQISWIGSPLMVPWWAEVHLFAGFVLFYWILTPILYYSNVWQLSHFPLMATSPYDRFGHVYNVTRVVTPSVTFNQTAYAAYSPLYLPATYAMTYLLAFAMSTCVLVHTGLYHGKALWNGLKKVNLEEEDIHAKLMRHYAEVPDWWFGAVFVIFFSIGVVVVVRWHSNVPVWALFLSILVPVIYILPGGFIFALTGQNISVNLLAQIIPGSLLPGNPLANMMFKVYSIQTLLEAASFVQDLKLGHYIKVPPRATFLVQLLATFLAAFVQVGVKVWLFSNVKDICRPQAQDHLVCPHNQVFFTASAVWGLIGPTRQFGAHSLYNPQLYMLLVGALLPLPFWLLQKRHPNSWIKYVSTPVIFNGVLFIPPATGINYSSWFMVAFIFQFMIRRRNFAWWTKFNYITSAALDSGTVISLVLIFFSLQFPGGGISLKWWGNTVYQHTADYKRVPYRPIPSGSALPWPS